MSVVDTTEVIHVSFDERFKFGSPYPSGVALAWLVIAGDATGGIINATVNAPSGFLYRMEEVYVGHATASPGVLDRGASVEFAHGWAQEKSGLTPNAFNHVHQLEKAGPGSTTELSYAPQSGDYQGMHRFPIGRTDLSLLGPQVIAELKVHVNVDLSSNVFSLLLTYWRLEATYRAGFLSSFYEAPIVPPAT